jgi:hypothetical protein
MSDSQPDLPPILTDANIFYNGFAEVSNPDTPPLPYGHFHPCPRMDEELKIWVPEPKDDQVWLRLPEDLRCQKRLVALLMVVGRRVDTLIDNNETIIKANQASSQAIVAGLDALGRTLEVTSQQNLAVTERIVQSMQGLTVAITQG